MILNLAAVLGRLETNDEKNRRQEVREGQQKEKRASVKCSKAYERSFPDAEHSHQNDHGEQHRKELREQAMMTRL